MAKKPNSNMSRDPIVAETTSIALTRNTLNKPETSAAALLAHTMRMPELLTDEHRQLPVHRNTSAMYHNQYKILAPEFPHNSFLHSISVRISRPLPPSPNPA